LEAFSGKYSLGAGKIWNVVYQQPACGVRRLPGAVGLCKPEQVILAPASPKKQYIYNRYHTPFHAIAIQA
jgi:hypothetical protein